MSIGNDEATLEAKRFLHLQRKSTPLARAEVTRHGSLTTGNQDTCCKWSHFHSAFPHSNGYRQDILFMSYDIPGTLQGYSAGYPIGRKCQPSKTNVPFKILRTGTVCQYFLRIYVCQGQYSVGTAGWCTPN